QGQNDNPHDLATVGLSVDENAANTTSVGFITSSDVDAGDTAASTLTNNAGGRFTIDSATGEVTVANGLLLNREDDVSHTITVEVQDTAGATYSESFTVTVNDVDEFDVSTPVDNNPAADRVTENAANDTLVGITGLASDADDTNNTVTYTLADSADGRFKIDLNSGIVRVADGSRIDREAVGFHDITIRATSADGSFADETFTILVDDVDEFDVSAITDSNPQLDRIVENSGINATVGITALASDDDATTNTVTYTLTNTAGGLFQIDSVTGAVTTAVDIDREAHGASQTITVRADSTDGSFQTQNFTILIEDVDEFDTVAGGDTDGAVNEIDENAAGGLTVGITAAAGDADATTSAITHTLIDSAGGRFVIDGVTGVVTTSGAAIDFETSLSHTIEVRSQSQDGSFVDQSFVIAVRNVNEAPISVADSYTTNAGQAVVLNAPTPEANDTDPENDTLDVFLVTGPSNGTLNIAPDGTITYTPDSGFFGTETLTYRADDGSLLGNTTTITIEVEAAIDNGGDGGDTDGGDTSDPNDPNPDSTDPDSDEDDTDSTDGGEDATDGLAPTPTSTSSTQGGRQTASGETEGAGDSVELGGDGPVSNRIGGFGLRQAVDLNDAAESGVDSIEVWTFDRTSEGTSWTELLSRDYAIMAMWHLTDEGTSLLTPTDHTQDVTVVAVGASLGVASMGYVLWTLRGGVFVATIYAGLPRWRLIDPASLLPASDASNDRVEQLMEKC
ncbi:MAG: cadherin domain-containing protein, partial [Planctomycetota bacterium]